MNGLYSPPLFNPIHEAPIEEEKLPFMIDESKVDQALDQTGTSDS